MINNIGKTSSFIRLFLGLSILLLSLTPIFNVTFALILFSLSGLLIVSGLFKSCPLTYIFQKDEEMGLRK
jgi:hypothetical protein